MFLDPSRRPEKAQPDGLLLSERPYAATSRPWTEFFSTDGGRPSSPETEPKKRTASGKANGSK